jgi:aminoglycoside 2'-N-acetyltransferase I
LRPERSSFSPATGRDGREDRRAAHGARDIWRSGRPGDDPSAPARRRGEEGVAATETRGGPRPGRERARLREVPTDGLAPDEIAAIRSLLWSAFASDEDGFAEDDWRHALGGTHFVLELESEIIGHAAVVERTLIVGGRRLRAVYVEAVAILPARQAEGWGSLLMERVTEHVRRQFELGALGTGRHHFYERLGWRTWQGQTWVQTAGGLRRTQDDDGYVLVLVTPSTPELDPAAPIVCEWRPGDVW